MAFTIAANTIEASFSKAGGNALGFWLPVAFEKVYAVEYFLQTGHRTLGLSGVTSRLRGRILSDAPRQSTENVTGFSTSEMPGRTSNTVPSRREAGSPSFTRLFTGGLVGFSQKVLDLVGYVTHRSWMLLRFRARQVQHRWLFRGRLHRILVVRIASIGDVARATAVVARLRDKYPDATIDFLTSPAAMTVIRGHSAVQTVYTLRIWIIWASTIG